MSDHSDLAVDHRRLAVDLFNTTWDLLDRAGRTTGEDDELVATAHASMYHWLRAPGCEPKNVGRAHWLCSRVHSALGHDQAASHHAARYLQLATAEPMDDWDLAAALEASARAAAVAGRWDEAATFETRAREACRHVADPQDRDVVLADLDALPRP